jgi:hypothetical protein
MFVILLVTAPSVQAQTFGVEGLETRASLSFSSALALAGAALPVGSWNLIGHLEARYTLEDLSLNLALDPATIFGPQARAEAGLTEAYALYRSGEFDIEAGVERLPLEVARLSLPYALEPVDALGRRRGVPGVRLSWNPEATRLRIAILALEGGLVPSLSARREFGDFEIEAHALVRAGRATLALTGSGTLEGLVLYGEAWAITGPLEWRYALGLSGALGDALWTLEGGYTSPAPGAPPRHLALGQVALPQGEDARWTLSGGAFFDTDVVRGVSSLSYTLSNQDTDLTISLSTQFGPSSTVWTLNLQVRSFLW